MLVLASLAGAAPRWVRVESGRFELYTNAGEAAARSVLDHLQQGRRIFRDSVPDARGVPLPVRVFLFAKESEFRLYRPAESAAGFFQSGPVRDIIAMPYRGAESLNVAMHEFVHLVLSHAAPKLPRWLEEGTAEFYSTLRVTGNQLRVGGVIPNHVSVLARSNWLDGRTLSRIARDSPEYNERGKVGIFYAESWALAHMLNLSPGYREHMPRFIESLADGQPPEAAFQDAFSKPLDAALRDLRSYVEGRRFPVVELDAGPSLQRALARTQEISSSDAEYALGDLAIQTGRLQDAERAYRRLANGKAPTAEVEGRLGMLALKLNQDDEALKHFRRAIELGTRAAETHFEYAMLLRDRSGDRTEVTESLRRAVTLSPNYAEAHHLLGLMASTEKHPLDAIEHLKRAAEILPRQPQFWHALALAASEAGDDVEARRAARRGRAAAETPREIEMAEALLQRVESPSSPPRPARPAVTTPPAWENPKGDRKLDGALTRIDCLGQAARFTVSSGGRETVLYVARPGEILLKNVSSVTFEFRCGPQNGQPVSVEYLAKPDARLGTAGEMTAIEFR